MIRYNTGNIVTNANQTLGISATHTAGIVRRDKANAASALNAQRKNEIEDVNLDEKKAKARYFNAKADDLESLTASRNARLSKQKSPVLSVGTPESEEVAKKISSDMFWQDYIKSLSESPDIEEINRIAGTNIPVK